MAEQSKNVPDVHGRNSASAQGSSFQSHNLQPPFPFHAQHNLDSLINASNALATLTLREPLCRLCKGQKYNFAAYFHNQKYFSSPPHHLLAFVEDSYALKNTLQSLLITYVSHEFEHIRLPTVRRRVEAWREGVDHLVNRVVDSAVGFQVELQPLVDVKNWASEMAGMIWDHILGKILFELPAGGWRRLVLGFRKLWEKVWQGYLKDQAGGPWSQKDFEFSQFQISPENTES